MTKFYSFGFSPSFFINQNDCDKHDCDENNICQDNRRLCWYIGGLTGGWRIGKFVSENNNNFDYNKLIFLKV